MALFTAKKYSPRSYSGNQVYIVEEQSWFPGFLRHLDRYCSRSGHLAVRMECITDDTCTSDRGGPMAVYACPLCNWREGYIRDRRRPNRAYRLWAGYNHGRR